MRLAGLAVLSIIALNFLTGKLFANSFPVSVP
jgi:hypothetical protein